MKSEKIKNLKGFLYRSFVDKFFFRTYTEDGTFNDYEICHSDLWIQAPTFTTEMEIFVSIIVQKHWV
jgi:hypothetical protein